MEQSTASIVIELVVAELNVRCEADDIGTDTPLFEGGLALDSFAIVDLITHIENRFGFEFADEDLEPSVFASVRSLASLIDSRTPGSQPASSSGVSA